MSLPLDGLDLLNAPDDLNAGMPLRLALDAIDEDPQQPRQEFDPDALAELATTIKERGVRQPVSVRPHPEQADRWMLNFGARRLRASRLAGLIEIPAFVDRTADSYDQVIENEQRQDLLPLELALFVQRRLRVGDSKADIALRLGKSRGYLTFICALIDAPDWLMAAYRTGRCRGLAELYELRRLHESEPEAVVGLLATTSKVTRADVQRLKDDALTLDASLSDELCAPDRRNELDAAPSASTATDRFEVSPMAAASVPSEPKTRLTGDPAGGAKPADTRVHQGKVRLWARLDDVEVVVNLGAVPVDEGCVFVTQPGGDRRMAVEAGRLKLLRVTRRDE